MAQQNALDNKSAPFTVTAGDMTVTSGNLVASSGALSVTNSTSNGNYGSFVNTTNDNNAGILSLDKNRAGGTITSGDILGYFRFRGFDGSAYRTSAQIVSTSTGTISSRVAGDLEFWTKPDSATGIIQRMTIASTGAVTIATPDSGTGLTVSGGGIKATAGAITATAGDVVITSGNLTLPNTTSSSVGSIKINSLPLMHVYGGTGTGNIFVGPNSGNYTLTTATAQLNTAIGNSSLNGLTLGTLNVASGYAAGLLNTSASNNSLFGAEAGRNILTGSNNTLIGYLSGLNYTGSEGSNILIGASVQGTVGESNVIRIGTSGSSAGQQNQCFIAGIAGVTVASSAAVLINTSTGQLGTVASSIRYKENIQDITQSNIMNLRPVSFNFKTDDTKATNYGFIAEEVAEHMPELVVYNTKGEPETVQYHQMYALLLKEIQNLKKEIDQLKKAA